MKYVKQSLLVLAGLLTGMTAFSGAAENYPDQYNVVWTSQSKNSSESMPVGGHSIGMTLWVENGDVLFYAQRSGSFTENNEYHKLGRFRLRLDPNPFAEGAQFRQELKLRQGHAEIRGKHDGLDVLVRVWVEVLRPVIHVDVESSRDIAANVAYEGWRNEQVRLDTERYGQAWGCFSWDSYPGDVIRTPDVVAHHGRNILFYHRNNNDQLLFDYAVKQQGLQSVKERLANTQINRTFGGVLQGEGFVADGTGEGSYLDTPYKAWNLRSERRQKNHALKIFTHVDQSETLDKWKGDLAAQVSEPVSDVEARKKTLAWWDAFWNRSWLVMDPGKGEESQAWKLGRNYQLFRYMLGCNFYGDYPSKFNGGNFTYDPSLVNSKKPFSPDWRAWGGGSFTAQNQRLVHWPMLKTGDFKAMLPQFEFYRRALPTAKARVDAYWGHDGAFFAEQIENFGLPIACAWGWSEPEAKGRRRSPRTEHGVLVNGSIGYHYESQLEFSYMILEYYRYTGADISPYMEFIKQSVRFFDEHYQMRHQKRTGKPLDENGKLVISPSTACESYKNATNPVDAVSGLRACLGSLLGLSADWVSDADKRYYREFLKRVPELSFGEVEGDRIIKPAAKWSHRSNHEAPQFYPLFPFNRFDMLDDDMTVFQNTYKHGDFPKTAYISWQQHGIFRARMGMTDKAKFFNTKKMNDSGRRFPAFWGPGYDWVPDHNWGGSGMIGLQEMIMQTIGDRIHIIPAWPDDWDADFKLHAPRQTIVQGKVRSGKVVHLEVTPAERKKDVVIRSK